MSGSEVLWVHADAEECFVSGVLVVSAAIGEDLRRNNRVTDEEVGVYNLSSCRNMQVRNEFNQAK